MSFAWRKVSSLVVSAVMLGALGVAGSAAAASGASSISGTVYQDLNRNQLQDAGEAAMGGINLYLLDASGNYLAAAGTDSSGHFLFGGLADGSYIVEFDPSVWWSYRSNWVPTTTGSVYFKRSVSLTGSAVADFGLRPIIRSTDISSPISSFTAPSGLVVHSYDDVIAAADVYAALATGSLMGPEAATTTVYFDYGTATDATMTVGGSPGSYSGFKASLWIYYVPWLDSYDDVLFHEYGHAWSLYNAYIVQQDPTLASYLQARGLAGDPRLGSAKAWEPTELIAEDYRQLFGSPNAASYPQTNTDIPPAAQVSGLKTFLQNTYTQAPATSGSPSGGGSGSSTTPAPPVAISGLTVSPQPVVKAGTVSFTISLPASVSVAILSSGSSTVRTLLSSVQKAAGGVSVTWNRTNAAGQRVKSGTYVASVSAVDASGHTVTSSVSFPVS